MSRDDAVRDAKFHHKQVSHCRRYRVPMSSLSCAKVVVIVCIKYFVIFRKPLSILRYHPIQNRCDTPNNIKNIKRTPFRLTAAGCLYN